MAIVGPWQQPNPRGLDDAGGVGERDGARHARPDGRRQHVPQPGPHGQARDRPSTTSATVGRSWASAAPGSSGSTMRSASNSGRRPGWRLDRLEESVMLIARLLDGERIARARRTGSIAMHDALAVPRPVQARLPILHRRLGAEEDPPHGRPLRRHLEQPAAPPRRCDARTRSSASAVRRSAATPTRSSGPRPSGCSSATTRARPAGAARGAGRPTATRGRRRQVYVGSAAEDRRRLRGRSSRPGSRHFIIDILPPYDAETLDRLPEVRELSWKDERHAVRAPAVVQHTTWAGVPRRGAGRRSGPAGMTSGRGTTCWRSSDRGSSRSSRAGPRWPASAPVTSRVRLGLMVGANTFRNPGLTAKLATTLDHVSRGAGGTRASAARGSSVSTTRSASSSARRARRAARPARRSGRCCSAASSTASASRITTGRAYPMATRSWRRARSRRICRSSSAAPGRRRRCARPRSTPTHGTRSGWLEEVRGEGRASSRSTARRSVAIRRRSSAPSASRSSSATAPPTPRRASPSSSPTTASPDAGDVPNLLGRRSRSPTSDRGRSATSWASTTSSSATPRRTTSRRSSAWPRSVRCWDRADGRRLGRRRAAGGRARRRGRRRQARPWSRRRVVGDRLTVVVNTGDDTERHGLLVMPDHDTVMYTLAGIANREWGWGIDGRDLTTPTSSSRATARRRGSGSVIVTSRRRSSGRHACGRAAA